MIELLPSPDIKEIQNYIEKNKKKLETRSKDIL